MNVLTLLKKDHDGVKSLFSRFERAGKTSFEKKSELFEQIRLELTVHFRLKEEIFYPAIKVVSVEGRRMVSDSMKEHKDIEELLRQIMHLRPEDPRFDDRAAALMEDVEEHIEREVEQLFQFAQHNCPEDELQRMAVEMERRKKVLESKPAA